MKQLYKTVRLSFAIASVFFCISASGSDKNNYPILILGSPGTYVGEILKTEGFNEFRFESLAGGELSLKYLKMFDLVIAPEAVLTDQQTNILTSYVREGGSLIAFRPDNKMAHVFGLKDKGSTIDEGYISIDTFSSAGKGLITETLQLHSAADIYQLDSGKKIASLYSSAVAQTGHPAVIINDFGKGHAIAFTYNLPKSIAFTRQGNPLLAGQEKDGINGIRAMDLFTGGWVDTSKNTLNQADEQMRLLTHCIEEMSGYQKPLPRFWYFPDTLKCLVTLTNDGEDSKENEFNGQFGDVNAKGAKMTLYIKETALISKTWVTAWANKGFELAAHYDDTKQAPNPDWQTMDSVIKNLNQKMKSKYGIENIKTVTNHWFVWCGKDSNGVTDFTAQAKLEVNNGMALDNNYARYDNGSNQGYFLGPMGTRQGNYTGSGLSMKFSTREGAVINLYQHLCNVYDQQYMEHKDSVGLYECFKGLMDRSLDKEVYSYISVKAHNNEYYFSKTPLLSMLDYAKEHGVPVWTTLKLLGFLEAKDEATFTDIEWKGNKQLSLRIRSGVKHSSKLACMVPYVFNSKRINDININGAKRSYSVKKIKGFDYAFFTVDPGSNYGVVVTYAD